jgi:predicted ribosome quality control (RQC) complex YloA/Tae2 family protein
MLTYEPTTGEFAAIEADGTLADAEGVGDAGADHGDDDTDDVFTRAFAGLGPGGEAQPTAFGEAVADAFSRLRIEQLEHERNVLSAERDEMRRRAEAAEADAEAARTEGNELRARIRELERLLDEERAAGSERSDNTRRAALALARAQQELDGLRSATSDPDDARPTRSRRPLRGNWLS